MTKQWGMVSHFIAFFGTQWNLSVKQWKQFCDTDTRYPNIKPIWVTENAKLQRINHMKLATISSFSDDSLIIWLTDILDVC